MRKNLIKRFIVMLLVSSSSFAIAHNHLPDRHSYHASSLDLLTYLVTWLESQSVFEPVTSRPDIVQVNNEALCELAYGSIHSVTSAHCHSIYGLYHYDEKTIYIDESFDLNSRVGQSIVLHELVHHYQYETGQADIYSLSELEAFSHYLERRYRESGQSLVINQQF